jgi:glycosyltransferase involved in cell wall biosynthesis
MLASLLRCKQLQRLVVISEALKQYFVQRHRVSPDRILVAHDGADLPTECEPLPLGDSARLRVGYVGHLDPGKGTDVIHRLAMLCPFAHFHLIGGRTEDISAWRVRTGGVDNMTFHGFVEPGQVERYRKAMDVLLVPYQKSVLIQGRLDTAQWMSPLKVFEYMASRRPMVISDLPVLREVVNERNAIIVPPDDMDQWRQALVRLRDPALRQRVADAAYADFVAHHTWHQRAQSVLRGL